jgi:hypothetical protein
MDWACGRHRGEERRGACKILLGRPQGKRPLGVSSYRRKDNTLNFWGRFNALD